MSKFKIEATLVLERKRKIEYHDKKTGFPKAFYELTWKDEETGEKLVSTANAEDALAHDSEEGEVIKVLCEVVGTSRVYNLVPKVRILKYAHDEKGGE